MNLTRTIDSVISHTPERSSVLELFEECHRFALAYLRFKRRGHYLRERIGLSLEDLALDCFADLFERDEDGRFVQIRAYFEDAGWPDLSEEEAEIALRRLVFSKVNDGLFRRYQEADSQVARIIRNIKLATRTEPDAGLVRRGNVLWLVVSDSELTVRRELLIPPELLEARIVARLHESTTINHVIASFIELVEAWPAYCNGYPVSSFARIVYNAFRRFGEMTSEHIEPESSLLRSELDEAVHAITKEVQTEMYGTYVGRKKFGAVVYNAYCQAARDILLAQFVQGAIDSGSYFETLKRHLPDLTLAAYRAQHRHVLEYLAKIVRRRLILYFERHLLT